MRRYGHGMVIPPVSCGCITHMISHVLADFILMILGDRMGGCPLPSGYFNARTGQTPSFQVLVDDVTCYLKYKADPATLFAKRMQYGWRHDTGMPMLLVYHPTRVQEIPS